MRCMMSQRISILFLVILLDGCTVLCGGGAASAAAVADDADDSYVFAGLVAGAFKDGNFKPLQDTLRAWKKRELLISCEKLNDLLTIAAQNGTPLGPVERSVHQYQRTTYVNELNSLMEKGEFSKVLIVFGAKKDHEFSDMAMQTLYSDRDRWATIVMTRDKELEFQLQKLRFLKFGRTFSNILKFGSALSFYEVIHRLYTQDSSILYLLLGLGALSTSFIVPFINPYEYIEKRRRDGQLLLAKVAQLDHVASAIEKKQHDSERQRSAETVVGAVVDQYEKKYINDGGNACAAVAQDDDARAAGIGLHSAKTDVGVPPPVYNAFDRPVAPAQAVSNLQAENRTWDYAKYFVLLRWMPGFRKP